MAGRAGRNLLPVVLSSGRCAPFKIEENISSGLCNVKCATIGSTIEFFANIISSIRISSNEEISARCYDGGHDACQASAQSHC